MKALYYGNNLQLLRDSIATEGVDLIYLDPPFNSNATYNVLFRSPKGAMQREKARMGLFITLAEPTAPMKKAAASAGVADTPFGKFARLQILTIEDLFAGKKPAMPPDDSAAFRKAASEEDTTRQGKLI